MPPAATIRAQAPASGPGTPAQQHDLLPRCAINVVRQAAVRSGEVVLEIGPGLGAITAALLAVGAKVHAVERDLQRVALLRERFAASLDTGQLTLHAGDAQTLRLRLPQPWRVVANPPFVLTAALVRRWLLEEAAPPRALDLILQRQTAEKLSGTGLSDGQTRSSVLTHLAGRPRIRIHLHRDDVTPPSRVDLCLWSLARHDDEDAPTTAELARIDRLLGVAFAGPHTITDALRGIASTTQIRRQAAEHDWDPAMHSRQLPVAAWRPLAALLATCKKI